jgi:CheY-like chemotaxis protein
VKRRALIVDDNRALAEDLGEILELEGYEVVVFDDSTRALRECEMQPFDVALLDVRMPGLDGVTLHRRLLERHPNTHFFMMTAYTEDERIASALAAGVRRVLTKPVPLAELLQVLEQESGAGRELLLLDDDAQFNATLAEVLRDSGYQVHSAHSLADARRVERADPWLAAIVDMRLPDGDGVSFAMELARRTPASVILVSGFELEAEGERLRKEFGERVQVLVKPFAPDVLLRALIEKAGMRA